MVNDIIKARLKRLLNESQVNTIVNNPDFYLPEYKMEVWKAVEYIIRALNLSDDDIKVKLIRTVVTPINFNSLNITTITKLKNKETMFVCVGNEFTYSYGASNTPDLPYEYIINSPVNAQAAYMIINEVKDRLGKDVEIDKPFTSANFNIGETDMRLKVVVIDAEKAINTLMFSIKTYRIYLPEKFTVVQIFVGDKNNLLPGEEGHDTTYGTSLQV